MRRPFSRVIRASGRSLALVTIVVLAAALLGPGSAAAAGVSNWWQHSHPYPAQSALQGSGASAWSLSARPSVLAGPGDPAMNAQGTATTIATGGGAQSVAIDQATHTAYVGNAAGTESVINTATCNAKVVSGCGQTPPTINVPANGPVDDAVDEATDTVYVTNLGANTVSVINGATCNASVTSGCGQTPATIPVGNSPDGVAIDEATDTIYVANYVDGTVSVINGATCNADNTSGCGVTPPTINVGSLPIVPAVNQRTDTVYVPNSGDGTVSVIDGAACNASIKTGCSQTPPTLTSSQAPDAVAVDEATDTVYVSAAGGAGGPLTNLSWLDVFNGATCNATATAGCGQTPEVVTVGSGDNDLVVDPVTQTVFVENQEDSTLSIVDGAICNALDTSGCGQHPPIVATGFVPGYLDVDFATDTVYVSNQDLNNVSVINGASCTLFHQSGCRQNAPTTTVGDGPQGSAIDAATNTIYVANQGDADVSVISGDVCNAHTSSGCAGSWPTVSTHAGPQAIAIDQKTDTVYVANFNDNTVSVINGATCNAEVHSGCGQTAPTVAVGNYPIDVDVDQATDTVYVANANFGGGSGSVSVIDGATCNATVTSGCGQTPQEVRVGSQPFGLAVEAATNTIYVDNDAEGTVSVINGVRCDAQISSGCDQPAPTIPIGPDPFGIVANQTTNTIYVADRGPDYLGTGGISVINGASCNGTHQSGCSQTPPTLDAGSSPYEITVDPSTNTVYATSVVNSNVDEYNGATCDATDSKGCSQTPASVLIGGWPGNPVVDQANGTVYVPDNVDGEVSYFEAAH